MHAFSTTRSLSDRSWSDPARWLLQVLHPSTSVVNRTSREEKARRDIGTTAPYSRIKGICSGRFFIFAPTLALFATILLLSGFPRPADSLPLYARQTGLTCDACHTAFFELTPAGRRFKLGAYTLGGGDWSGPPFAAMIQPAFTHTQSGDAGNVPAGFGRNNNVAMQQVSLFTGGRFTDELGAFIQGTYDGVNNRIGWDNTDIRYAHSLQVGSHDLLLGLSANNNPTVQDVWNTTPAWRFPFISSAIAPQPVASTFIDGAFSQRVMGLSMYALFDDIWYLETGAYRPLSVDTQRALGVVTTGESTISGLAAPYWRAAVEPVWGDHSLEIGTFGLKSNVTPPQQSGAGTDSFTDAGIDSQYQYITDPHVVTFRAAWIHETHDLGASHALGLATNSRDTLRSLNASVSYIYDRTWSFTLSRSVLQGTADPALYGTFNGSPNSSNWLGEIAYLPFMHGGPAFWPWLNARIGLQYTLWGKFDGTTSNIDGLGRKAHDNNTVFIYAWLAF